MNRCPVAVMSWADVADDPHGTFAKHREAHWYAPIEGTPLIEVLTYADARALMADDARMREYLLGHLADAMSMNPRLNPELGPYLAAKAGRALINLDGEAHQRLRSAVARAFTPRSVAAIRPALEDLAARLADALLPGHDFVEQFARVLPARGLCMLTGIPEHDHERFAAWIDVLQESLSPVALADLSREQSDAILATQRELDAYTLTLVADRRANPRDDLISRLSQDEAGLDDETIAGLAGDLIFAGNDTTRKGIAAMALLFASEPDAWEAVSRDASLAGPMVEEVLRLCAPAPGPVRRAACAFEHQGEEIADGQVAALSIWSANRDPAFWGDGVHDFEPGRENGGQHLSFGHGAHFCLGASLAREEMRAALVALSSRITAIRVVGTPPMPPVGSIYGPLALNLAFERRVAAAG